MYELPKRIDGLLAALTNFYSRTGPAGFGRVLVNAHVRVDEATSMDNWNGGTYGHTLWLTIPEPLFLDVLPEKDEFQRRVKTDLNKLYSGTNEFIEDVALEMAPVENYDWRAASGLLASTRRPVPPEAQSRIWAKSGYRVFLSHKAEEKRLAADLKERLQVYGCSCFVAHEDIAPTEEWQSEIENALHSMNAFVALLTPNFHDSLWTDQEVGFAFGRGVPIVCVRMGKDPYGFIGKFQALSHDHSSFPQDVIKLLVRDSRMVDAYIEALTGCPNFDRASQLAGVLPMLTALTDDQVSGLIDAYNGNSQLKRSFRWNEAQLGGKGLVTNLERITGLRFVRTGADRRLGRQE